MKSLLFKKVTACAAMLAIAMQMGIALPVSADTAVINDTVITDTDTSASEDWSVQYPATDAIHSNSAITAGGGKKVTIGGKDYTVDYMGSISGGINGAASAEWSGNTGGTVTFTVNAEKAGSYDITVVGMNTAKRRVDMAVGETVYAFPTDVEDEYEEKWTVISDDTSQKPVFTYTFKNVNLAEGENSVILGTNIDNTWAPDIYGIDVAEATGETEPTTAPTAEPTTEPTTAPTTAPTTEPTTAPVPDTEKWERPTVDESLIYYSQNYEDATSADWTTGSSGRYTPMLKKNDTNTWLGVDMSTRQNNGAMLTSPDYSSYVADKEEYLVEFDAALGFSDGNQKGNAFKLNTSDGHLLNLTTSDCKSWIINGNSNKTFTPATTGYVKDNSTADVASTSTWYHYVITYKNGDTHLMICDTDNNIVFGPEIIVSGTKTGKLSKMTFATSRYNSNFEIDNVVIRGLDEYDKLGERQEETLNEIVWDTQLNTSITQPAEGEPVHKPLTVKATGIYGNDLTDKCEIEWSVVGLGNEDGYISLTAEEGTGSGTEGETPTGSTAYFNVRNGVSNWFGKVNVTVKYLDETLTISTPFAVIGASGASNNIAPAAGYPVDMSDYDDDLIGYSATSNGETTQDLVLNNWSIYGSNGSRTLTLNKDDDGTKYLRFASNGGGASTVGVYQLAEQSKQYNIDMKVRFSGGDMTFGHYFKTPNNSGSDANWTASYASGALTVGTQTITGLNTTDWFRILVSADESAGTFWVKVYDKDGTLIGMVEDETLLSTYTATQKYFCLYGTYPVDLASFKIYYPTAGELTINADKETVQVPEATATPASEDEDVVLEEVTNSSISYKDGKVIVKIDGVEKAVLLYAKYDAETGEMTAIEHYDLTFADGIASQELEVAENSKLMVWDSLDENGAKPLCGSYSTKTETPPSLEPTTPPSTEPTTPPSLEPTPTEQPKDNGEVSLAGLLKDTDGHSMTGKLTWSLDEEYAGVTIEDDGTQSAKLKVTSEAGAGTITVIATYGSMRAEKEISLSTSGNAIAFTKFNQSLTIPFDGKESVTAEFVAEARNKDGNKIDGTTVTYEIVDASGEPVTGVRGVTFDAETGVLKVEPGAASKVVYIKATSQVDDEVLTSRVKVNIHGLSFAFGSGESTDDSYTQVTAADTYTDKLGYGFADTSAVTNAESNVVGSADYRFKVKVPNGNYVVEVTTTADSMKSEVVESVTATTGITKSGSKFNVAVCDGVLDLTFPSGSTLTNLVVTQAAAKTKLEKPALYAIGDSTTNNNAEGNLSWGNAVSGNLVSVPETFSSFSNNGMAGRDSVSFYNQGRVESVLLNVCPGDYVTVNMGINSKETNEAVSFYNLVNDYYVQGIIQRGAIPVIVTSTPLGFSSKQYPYSNGKFTVNRGTGAQNGTLRKIAQENELNIIELSYYFEDYFNNLTDEDVAAYNEANGTSYTSVLELVKSWWGDHNHYKEPLAVKIAPYILECVEKIANGSTEFNQANDPHINEQ